jgi:hypothetical protein
VNAVVSVCDTAVVMAERIAPSYVDPEPLVSFGMSARVGLLKTSDSTFIRV